MKIEIVKDVLFFKLFGNNQECFEQQNKPFMYNFNLQIFVMFLLLSKILDVFYLTRSVY